MATSYHGSVGNSNIELLLEKLNLKRKYPEKITLRDVISVRFRNKETSCSYASLETFHQQLPWTMLRGLILRNQNVRDQTVPNETDQGSGESDEIDELLTEINASEETLDRLHPSDVFLTIFYCCDFQLRQVLVRQLFSCKMAFPFLLRDLSTEQLMVSLWPLRSICMEWCDKQARLHESPCLSIPPYIASVIRIGEHGISKSELINKLVFAAGHNSFFNRNCPNGSLKRSISGFVEGTWHIPSKGSDLIDKPVMFLNLRANALESLDALALLGDISTVVLVLVDVADLENKGSKEIFETLRSRTKIMLILVNRNGNQIDNNQIANSLRGFKRDNDQKLCIINGINASESKIVERMKNRINECFGEFYDFVEEQDTAKVIVTSAEANRIQVDGHANMQCHEGIQKGENIFKRLQQQFIDEGRRSVLPFQGSTWLEYSRHLKKERRFLKQSSRVNEMVKRDKHKVDMIKQRNLQYKEMKNSYRHRVIGDFTKLLLQYVEGSSTVEFALVWLSQQLDAQTKILLPEKRKQYNESLKNILKTNDYSEESLKKLKLEVRTCEQALSNNVIGLEHMFREVGQLYEAQRSNKVVDKDFDEQLEENFKRLPGVMAKFIHMGYSFEIMDGDVMNIPIIWVRDVFQELKRITGNAKILVLSILGIQSSGKSTLLNAMFGIEFSVSAGRCTKGLFVQLIPIDKTHQENSNIDYILVIDTEGLRAPELNNLMNERDNELSTLALGLSDITIINIKGENTTEMKDTLQIAMHAFLRMKLADSNFKTKQICMFVHNNVSAVSASDVLRSSHHVLVSMLQDLFREATKQVDCGEIKSYKDILDFEVDRHVRYLPDLWYGDPPMAPINPGYVESVTDIKQFILNDIVPSIDQFLTLSEFSDRINDLWNAVLAEDFIFRFRNSLEANLCEEISSDFQNKKRKLRKDVALWVAQEAERDLISCMSKPDLKVKYASVVRNLNVHVTEQQESAAAELNDYFDNMDWKYITEQWRQFTINELNKVCKQLCARFEDHLRYKRHERELQLIQKDEIGKIKADILRDAKLLAKQLRSEGVSEAILESEFDKMWNKVSQRVPSYQLKDPEIVLSMQKKIGEHFESHHNIITPLLAVEEIDAFGDRVDTEIQGTFDFTTISDDGVKNKRKRDAVKQFLSSHLLNSHDNRAQMCIDEVLKKVQFNLKKQLLTPKQFEEESVDEILDIIDEKIKENNEGRNAKIKIQPILQAKLVIHVCRYAYPIFVRQQRKYEENNSIAAKVEAFKQTCYNYFKNAFNQSKTEVLAADMFCDIIKQELTKNVNASMPAVIVDEMLHTFATKHRLIVRILRDLKNDKDFHKFLSYIKDPSFYAEQWIEEKIKAEWSRNEQKHWCKYTKRSRGMVRTKLEYMRQIIDRTFEKSQEKDLEEITHNFCYAISSHVPIPVEVLETFITQKISDFSHLQSLIGNRLRSIEQEIYKILDDKEIFLDHKAPSKEIMKEIWGCREQCPFCNEPCSDSTADHSGGSDHSCVQHRPEGINGRVYYSNNKLVVETCSFHIQTSTSFYCFNKCQQAYGCKSGAAHITHKYRDYRKYFRKWHITPSAEAASTPYWCWFMYTFRNELTEYYKAEMPDIPENWQYIDENEADDSLSRLL